MAKGIVAERGRLDMDEAFALLPGYALSNRTQLSDVALAIIDHKLSAGRPAGPQHRDTTPPAAKPSP